MDHDDDRELRDSVRDRAGSNAWEEYRDGRSLAPLPTATVVAPVRRRRRWALLIACAAAMLVVAAWPRSTPAPAGAAAQWNVELESTGPRPVTALVFGEEGGIHLVRLPAAGSAPDERRRVPVRLERAKVYMVALGRDRLDVSTTSPRGSAPMSFTARSRFVTLTLVHTPRGTGIRTTWW